MIQSILLFTLRPGVTDEQVEALRAALAAIPSEGRRNMRLGRDIGLLDGAMDLAIVTDVYAAREAPDPAVSGRLVADAVPPPARARSGTELMLIPPWIVPTFSVAGPRSGC